MSVGSNIALRRKELKLTQEELAEKLDISYQAVSAWERNKYQPEIDKLADIARALSTSVAWLLDETDSEPRWELKDDMFSVERMYNQVKFSAGALKMHQTQKALPLMKKYHEGQVRKGKDKIPFIAHPLLMACHALALDIADDELLAAVLLHDVVEDCGVTAEELDVNENVREAVRLVSFVKPVPYNKVTKKAAKLAYYENMKANKTALMVKLLDRCCNISQMATGFTKEHIAEYIDETEEMIFPLIDHAKHNYPEYYNAAFLIKYQMRSVMESLKRMI